MEILPQCHIIESSYQNRRISSYLLAGRQSLLVDSGFAFTPDEVILPYMKQHDLHRQGIDWLVVTHASADHFGGNHTIKQQFPSIKIIAHQEDADSVEDRQAFLQEHKLWSDDYGFQIQPISAEDFDLYFGKPTSVDLAFRHSVRISLDQDWHVFVIHTPGHTPGHCIVFDPQSRAVFGGDAILGLGVPSLDGTLTMPPHYFELAWYLETINKIAALDPELLFLTHYTPLKGEEVRKFLQQSEDFAYQCNLILEEILKSLNNQVDSATLISRFRAELGIPEAENQYQLLLRAHLNHLQNQDKLSYITENSQKTWIYTDRSDKRSGQGRSKAAM